MGEEEIREADVLDLAIQNEYENSSKFELGSNELTKSNNTIASLYKAKGEILRSQVELQTEADKLEMEKEVRLAEIEAEERKDKRQTRQRYVQTGCMVGLGLLAMFGDSDTFIGRQCRQVFGFASKMIFKI